MTTGGFFATPAGMKCFTALLALLVSARRPFSPRRSTSRPSMNSRRAIEQAKPGDRIVVADGKYAATDAITIAKAGTARAADRHRGQDGRRRRDQRRGGLPHRKPGGVRRHQGVRLHAQSRLDGDRGRRASLPRDAQRLRAESHRPRDVPHRQRRRQRDRPQHVPRQEHRRADALRPAARGDGRWPSGTGSTTTTSSTSAKARRTTPAACTSAPATAAWTRATPSRSTTSSSATSARTKGRSAARRPMRSTASTRSSTAPSCRSATGIAPGVRQLHAQQQRPALLRARPPDLQQLLRALPPRDRDRQRRGDHPARAAHQPPAAGPRQGRLQHAGQQPRRTCRWAAARTAWARTIWSSPTTSSRAATRRSRSPGR